MNEALARVLRTSPKECRRGHQDDWVVTVYRANYSTFNGGRRTPSNYSQVTCTRCGRVWRTNAAYVEQLPRA
jgi:hypothetical protein